MIATGLRTIAQLTRLEIAAYSFSVVLIPLLLAGRSLTEAVESAFPVMTICMSGFILNNIHDAERDFQNHPDRPLPRSEITKQLSAAIFFALLGLSLLLIKLWILQKLVFFYLSLLVSMIIYNYVVVYFAYLKNLVVAIAGPLPIVIESTQLGALSAHLPVIFAAFFFLLSIEMLSDIEDAAADGETLVKLLGVRRGALLAFALKAVSDVALCTCSNTFVTQDLSLVAAIGDLSLLYLWVVQGRRKLVIRCIQMELLAGLVYLI